MNEVAKKKLRGLGWLIAFLITGVVAATFAMNQIEELVNDLIGGLWDELRSDFLGFLLSYTWGMETWLELFFNAIYLFLIVLIPLLLFRQFLKKNRDFDFLLSKSWRNWSKALLILSASSLGLYVLSVWQTARALSAGESLSLSARHWELVSLVFAFLWIACLFLAIFMVSAVRSRAAMAKVGLKTGVYWFAVLSVAVFIVGRAFSPPTETAEEIFQEFDFMRTTPETVSYADVCATWRTLSDSYASLDLETNPTGAVEQRIEISGALELILLESLYFFQLRDPTWSEPYNLRGRAQAFTRPDRLEKVLPSQEAERLLSEVQGFDLEDGLALALPFMQSMDARCPSPASY